MQEIEEEEDASCSKQQQLHVDDEESEDASCSKLHKPQEDTEEEEVAWALEYEKYSDRYGRHVGLSEASGAGDLACVVSA